MTSSRRAAPRRSAPYGTGNTQRPCCRSGGRSPRPRPVGDSSTAAAGAVRGRGHHRPGHRHRAAAGRLPAPPGAPPPSRYWSCVRLQPVRPSRAASMVRHHSAGAQECHGERRAREPTPQGPGRRGRRRRRGRLGGAAAIASRSSQGAPPTVDAPRRGLCVDAGEPARGAVPRRMLAPAALSGWEGLGGYRHRPASARHPPSTRPG